MLVLHGFSFQVFMVFSGSIALSILGLQEQWELGVSSYSDAQMLGEIYTSVVKCLWGFV